MTPRMGRALGEFQHRVAIQITGIHTCWRLYKVWEYPPLEAVIQKAGFEEVEAYVLRRNNTVGKYTATRTILYLCEKTVRRTGTWVSKRWWEHEGLDLEGSHAAEAD